MIINLILQRLALGVLTLFVVSLVIFTSVEMLPGDFAQAILGQSATAETLQAYRDELGLERPAVSRYLEWLGNAVQGDLGASLANGKPISELIGARLGNTLFLAGMTAAIAVPFAVSLGILAALFRNSWFDRSISVSTLTSISFPEFFVAYVLILWFAIKLQWFPALANIASDSPFETRVFNSILPSLTLTLVVTAHMMRMTRASIINLMASPYIEMARLKGASPSRTVLRHALPNAVAPIVNVVALNLGYLITGVVIVEVIFVYPGLGQLLVDSVTRRDLPVVQAACLIFAGTFIILNLIADVVAIVSNPRLLHPK
ncbi:ABC transporter permease [Rhodobacteraceae bacterium]|nr:ABC transporter permease [Paracoccaceae bacterium]